ncbi:MAG: zf-TFIIB domain-containing protein [Betaproteobacteria bacterium]|nr:zf-TFIIB domain-containing protein [Betaproteobacteria bacterium]
MILICPNCSEPMDERRLEGSDGGDLAIDLCFGCHVIWFDSLESPRLAPGAVMDLLRLIGRHRQKERQILREHLNCPHCGSPLDRTDDLVKGGRIRYYRCSHDGGRLTPFLQFLIEKLSCASGRINQTVYL